MVLVDETGTIRFWSTGAEDLFGHSASQAEGRTLDLIVPPELRERHWNGFRRAWREGISDQVRTALLPVLCADGEVRQFPGRFEAVRGPHDEIAALMGVWTAWADGDDALSVLS